MSELVLKYEGLLSRYKEEEINATLVDSIIKFAGDDFSESDKYEAMKVALVNILGTENIDGLI